MTATKTPAFIVIGAPKAGTTTLFHYLKQHPSIFLPHQKELHYFSYNFLRENVNGPGDNHALAYACRSVESYKKHFRNADSHQMIGEISPSYLYFHETARKIKRDLGNIRIIVLLRNPVDKAHSQYMHLVRDNREQLSFYDALMQEEERRKNGWSDFWRYAESSLYAEKLGHFIYTFGRENVHIVLFEELICQARNTLGSMYEFLNIARIPMMPIEDAYQFNSSGRPKSRRLASLFARPSTLKDLAKKYIPGRMLSNLRKLNTGKKDSLDDRSRRYLTMYFDDDLKNLEQLIERPLIWRSANASKLSKGTDS